jgi:hypothetical protein
MRPHLAVLLATLAAASCSSSRDREDERGDTAGAEGSDEDTPLAPLFVTDLAPDALANAVPLTCDASADERCNGVDDDCDDGIDEACGVSAGRLQITAFWTSGADIDLYVVDPRGETLSFQRPTSVGGGELERASRGRCEGRAVETASIESVRWPERTVPSEGIYEVYLHYWGECLSGAGAAEVIVSVSAGRPVGSWSIALVPNDRTRVLAFEITNTEPLATRAQ